MFACYCMASVFKTSLCNQFSIIVGHLVYQHRSLRTHAYDFVAIHLMVITAIDLNACITSVASPV